MNAPLKFVLSASRRTDIPAFYMDWFMDRMDNGAFEVRNPYNGQIRHVIATVHTVHTIVFWSKNFGPFLDGGYGERLKKMGFNLFFNFTLNSESKRLEPNVPPLSDRMDQLSELTAAYTPESISWRFDPLCRYTTTPGDPMDNFGDFNKIAEHAGYLGITRCITSFMDLYPKIQKRIAKTQALSFLPVSIEEQGRILNDMQSKLKARGLQLFACCEKQLLQSLPQPSGIEAAACIPNDLLMRLFGGDLSLKKDSGQRVSSGCGCKISVDIGAYDQHPCFHNCLYCYANPSAPFNKEKIHRSSGATGGNG
ncbi:MAG: DUF1848 domain-containing protein [Pseudomonadota bacterium]